MTIKKFNSVNELLGATSDDKEFNRDVKEQIRKRELIKLLIALRNKHSLSQQDVAEKMGCTQSKISKLENGLDEEIDLGTIESYADILGMDVVVTFRNREATAVDEVKYHTFRIAKILNRLVSLTKKDDTLGGPISEFIQEFLFNAARLAEQAQGQIVKSKRSVAKVEPLRVELVSIQSDKPTKKPAATKS